MLHGGGGMMVWAVATLDENFAVIKFYVLWKMYEPKFDWNYLINVDKTQWWYRYDMIEKQVWIINMETAEHSWYKLSKFFELFKYLINIIKAVITGFPTLFFYFPSILTFWPIF